MTRRIRWAPVWMLLVVLGLVSAPVSGQGRTGTIGGEVRDASGGVLPGVPVTITNVGTGAIRTVTTDASGRYQASNLPVGSYKVAAELAGFKTTTRTGITLTMGQEAVVGLAMAMGDLAENVMVTGEAPLINVTNAVIGGLINQKAILELPLNGRSFIELATLRSGVTIAENGTQSESQGFGKKISISGSRFTSNVFLLDGTVMNDSYNSAGGAAGGAVIGVETVREFKVVTNAYSAEYGQHTGGVINAVTKSGTNEFHGSLYEFHRNDKLDAPNFFDPGAPPDFMRNQYGVSIGGPILRNRTFFFGNYEGLRETLGRTELLRVPSLNARLGLMPDPKTGQLVQIKIDPDVLPLIAQIWPLPNSTDFGNGTAEFIRESFDRTTQSFVSARVDHRLSDADTVFARYTFDDASRKGPVSINVDSKLTSRNQYATIEYGRVISPQLLNTANIGFTQSLTGKIGSPLEGFDRVTFGDSEFGHGVVNILSGMTSSGSGNLDPRIFVLNNFQAKNDLAYQRGNHQLKAGASISRLQHNDTSPRQPAGQFDFNSWTDFLEARPVEALLSLSENYHRYVRQSLVGAYVQDDWRLRNNLTLNAGVRWEAITRPKEIRGNNPIGVGGEDQFFNGTATPKSIVLGDSVFQENPSLTNFAPRVGFAWVPFSDGKTSVRGGAGLFHEPLLYWTYRMALWHTTPIYIEGRLIGSNVPIDFPGAYFTQRELFVGTPRYESIDPSPAQPHVAKFSLEVQRSMTDSMAVNVGYSGTRGRNLGYSTEINSRQFTVQADGRLFFPQGGPVLNLNFGRSRHRAFIGESNYDSLRLEFDKRFGAGLQLQSGYTFSKNMDDGASITGSTDFTSEQGSARHYTIREYGLSPMDVTHNFTFTAMYAIPELAQGLTGVLLGGWRVNGLLRLSSGAPFSVATGFDRQRSVEGAQYPNLAAGASNNPVQPGNYLQYFDPAAFELQPAGFLGNLGRNTLRAPGLATVDFSLAKTFHLGDDFKLEFRSEVFNLLNRANFDLPQRSVFASNGTVRPDAGRITATNTSSRQMQLAVKLIF